MGIIQSIKDRYDKVKLLHRFIKLKNGDPAEFNQFGFELTARLGDSIKSGKIDLSLFVLAAYAFQFSGNHQKGTELAMELIKIIPPKSLDMDGQKQIISALTASFFCSVARSMHNNVSDADVQKYISESNQIIDYIRQLECFETTAIDYVRKSEIIGTEALLRFVENGFSKSFKTDAKMGFALELNNNHMEKENPLSWTKPLGDNVHYDHEKLVKWSEAMDSAVDFFINVKSDHDEPTGNVKKTMKI